MGDSTPTSESYNAFISYSSKDVEAAEKLNAKLVEAVFSVWFDKARLNPGCNWHKEIEVGCKASRVLLPVLTPNWQASTWTRYETYETYGAEAILPLHVSGKIEDVLTPPLSRVQAVAIDPLTASDEEWAALFETLRELLAEPRIEKGERTAYLQYRPNPNFVGREHDLLNIHEALYQTPTAALTQGQSVSVSAMGGVGKTTTNQRRLRTSASMLSMMRSQGAFAARDRAVMNSAVVVAGTRRGVRQQGPHAEKIEGRMSQVAGAF